MTIDEALQRLKKVGVSGINPADPVPMMIATFNLLADDTTISDDEALALVAVAELIVEHGWWGLEDKARRVLEYWSEEGEDEVLIDVD